MDMAEIEPLMRVLWQKLLRPGGYFVFSVMHRSFQRCHVMVAGLEAGMTICEYSLKLSRYLRIVWRAAWRSAVAKATFHRPLHVLLGVPDTGFSIGRWKNRLSPEDYPWTKFPLTWGRNFSQIRLIGTAAANGVAGVRAIQSRAVFQIRLGTTRFYTVIIAGNIRRYTLPTTAAQPAIQFSAAETS